MGSRYHIKIAGQGFLLRQGSYRRVASALGPAGTASNASGARNGQPSWGWRQWHQSDWRGGDGQRVETETGGREDVGRWRTGYGIDVAEPGRLRLAPVLSTSYLSTENGFAAMLTFQGKLYALPTSSGKIYSYDGSTWGLAFDTGKSSMRSLARYRDRLYAGSGSDGTVFAGDGTAWSSSFQVVGTSSIACMASYGIWDPTVKATVPRLFLGCQFPGEEARIYQWDGSTLAEVHRCQEAGIEAMVVYGGRLYVATSDSGNGVQGRVLCFDGRSASGEWSEVDWLSDNYVAGWAIFDNLLFCGSGTGGKLWAFDGGRRVEAYSLSTLGLEYTDPLRALGVCAGKLYVGYNHPSQGVALLCKLGAGDWGLGIGGGPQTGWFTPCTAGSGGTPRGLAVYGGRLYLGSEAEGTASVYRRETDSHRDSGLLETSFFDGGQPGLSKLLRSLTLGHDKLLAGHYLEVRFALDDSDTFQQVEAFDSLASCDPTLTTADWRAIDSLVRLLGMPLQGFAGKRQGNPSIPHTARKLISSNPNSPPASFAEEFVDAEYAAVSTLEGGTATVTSALDGSYVHQLFEFDLAGLNPAGLHPRAICYGRGNNSGEPAGGVIFRMWNHATGFWDVVGSHTSPPESEVADRTLETTVTSFGCYVGSSGRVYLSLRSSYAASAANPSEVGADLVELGALWADNGEAVSEPLRLPASEPVSGATLTLLSSLAPPGTEIELYMSVDGGEHWEAVSDGVQHSFAYPGSSLRWKARFSTLDGLNTPCIERLKVDYFTGIWLPLGRSDTEGSTSATFYFENNVAARRVAFRIELASSDSSSSPALTSIALQYAPRPETKRRWEFEAICEGAAGVPLRLLDGSEEGKEGRELSQILWQARARGTTTFEDAEGGLYQVWFEGLEERLSDAAQERGAQTVAWCRMTEC